MPMYDCGDPDCAECQYAFGPDRAKAVAAHKMREQAYANHEKLVGRGRFAASESAKALGRIDGGDVA